MEKTKEQELKEEIGFRKERIRQNREPTSATPFIEGDKINLLKAELKGYQSAKQEFLNMIEKLIKGYKLKENTETNIILNELKSKLKGEK